MGPELTLEQRQTLEAFELGQTQARDLMEFRHKLERETEISSNGVKSPRAPRKAIRPDVQNWLVDLKRGTSFTPLEIAKALDRDPSSVIHALIWLRDDSGRVALMDGTSHSKNSVWKLIK